MRYATVLGLTLLAASTAVPSGAAAAQVAEVHAEPYRSGTAVVYTALPGKVNDVTMAYARPGDGRRPVTEAGGSLIVGPGCEEAIEILCGDPSSTGIIRLGDRDDRADHRSYSSAGIVYGGPGDDDVLSDGLDGLAYGGQGDDHLRVGSNTLTLAKGGPGDDRLEGLAGGGIQLFGGPDDDFLSDPASRTAISTLDGGPGNDRLEGHIRGQLLGGPGRDVVIVLPAATGAYTIEGGEGRDLIAGGRADDHVNAGAGNDAIHTPGGGGDFVICGIGYDVVIADPADAVQPDCESVTVLGAI